MDDVASKLVDLTVEILSEQYKNYRNLKNAPFIFDLVEALGEKLQEGNLDLGENEMKLLQEQVEKTRDLLQEIEKNETYKGMLLGKYARRLRYAKQLKEQEDNFKECLERINFRKEMDKLLEKKEKKPEDILQGDQLTFWKEVIRTSTRNSEGLVRKRAFWHCYKVRYADDFEALEGLPKKTVEKFLFESDGGMISIYGFRAAVYEFDFPFSVSEEAQKLKDQDLSVSDRLLLSDRLNGLVNEWTSLGKNVRRYILSPIKKETEKMEEGEEKTEKVRKVIDGWYEKMKEKDSDMSVDNTRREWNHFYTRFSVLWQISRFSHELFRAFDFPGRTRVLEFVRYCELMDEANYRIIINELDDSDKSSEEWKKMEGAWKSHRPKVYTFLREWLAEKGTENIPGEVLLGGERKEYQRERVERKTDRSIKKSLREKEDARGEEKVKKEEESRENEKTKGKKDAGEKIRMISAWGWVSRRIWRSC